MLEEIIFNKELVLNVTLKKNIMKNFDSITMYGLIEVAVKQEQMEWSGLAALLELADENGEVNLERVLNYKITQE